MENNSHKGHRKRMREDFYKQGFENWHKHKVLEYLLYYTIPVADTNELAHKLIKGCGGFTNIFSATKQQLLEINGVGEKTADYLVMLGEFMNYYNSVKYDVDALVLDREIAKKHIINLFSKAKRECLYVICLDPKSRILKEKCILQGSFDSMDVDVHKIMQTVIKSDASHVVLAHNHPSGELNPSRADIVTTEALERLLYTSGVKLLDHIIVGDGECASMRDGGHLK